MELKKYLKQLREKKDISQEAASKLIGVSVATIQNWERGDNKPDTNSIANIAKVYDVKAEDILKIFAREIDNSIINDISVISGKKEQYKSILPNHFKYSLLDEMIFTKEEVEVFTILALSIECNDNPLQFMYNTVNNYLDLSIILDKFKKYDLYKSKLETFYEKHHSNYEGYIDSKVLYLTDKGSFLFKCIKKYKLTSFNPYLLEFNDFLTLSNLYKLCDNLDIIIKLIKNINNKTECYLRTFDDYGFEENIYSDIKKINNHSYNNKYYTIEEALNLYLDEDYYEVIESENDTEEYIKEKELYTRKLEFYEANKELNEGLIKPKEFKQEFYKKAILRKKGLDFIEILNQ